MQSVPECLSCGTCCFSDLPSYVRVTGDDHERLGELSQTLVYFDGYRASMRMKDGHCAALEIDQSGRFFCSVYAVRPETCRTLERGSSACEGERATKAHRPLLAVERLLRTARATDVD